MMKQMIKGRAHRTKKQINKNVKIWMVKKNTAFSYRPRVKMQGLTWDFKIGDPDDHPSVPHGHAIDTGYRLDAWTGEIYPAGNERKKVIGNVTSKELKKLHSDPKFIVFAIKQIEWYQKEYPDINFCIPEWFRVKNMKSNAHILSQDRDDTYVFYCTAYLTDV